MIMDDNLLTDDCLRQITAAGEVDILVGVTTLNDHDTIARVINAIRIGLVKYFPRERSALIHVDGGSTDGTQQIVIGTAAPDFRTYLASSPLRTMHTLTATYGAMQGKGGALHVTLAAAELLRAKVCAVVSPDLESLTPEWIETLARPILREGFDLLAPIYQRHRFDGLLISHVLSPLVATAYGCEIEEPLGAEMAFSGRLVSHLLSLDAWQQDFMRFAPEIWMVTSALVGDSAHARPFSGPKCTRKSPAETPLPQPFNTSWALFSSAWRRISPTGWLTRACSPFRLSGTNTTWTFRPFA